MKRILSILILTTLIFTLYSCAPQVPENPENPDAVTTRIGYFPGTTGIGMAKMIDDAPEGFTFQKYADPKFITTALQSGEIDIAAFPTNAVPNLYKNAMGGDLQMLAINTLGVLYICTNGVSIYSIQDLSGKTVYYPEQAPKLVLEYILEKNNITDCDLQPSTLDALPGAIVSGTEVQIAILPEPKVTVAANQATTAGSTTFAISLDLSLEWDKVSDEPLVQGCVVVRKSFADEHPEEVEDFLNKYEESINFMKNPANLEAAAQMVVDAGILPALPVAMKAIPRSNITYMDGEEMIAAATAFLNALGMQIPEGEFFCPIKTKH